MGEHVRGHQMKESLVITPNGFKKYKSMYGSGV